MELKEYENDFEAQIQTFVQSTDIAYPIQETVHVTIDPMQIEIELESDLDVHPIYKLIRPRLLENVTEYAHVLLSQGTKLIVSVLQAKISQLDFIHDFLA